MLKDSFKNLGLAGKLLTLFFVFFVFSLIGMAIVSLFFGNSTDIQTLKVSQLLLSVFTLLLPPIICGYLWYEKPWQAYSLDKLPSGKQTVLAVVLILAISPFINLLSFINEQMVLPEFLSGLEAKIREMEDNAGELTTRMLEVNSLGGMLFNLLVMAIMPAVSEELFCRGALLNIFSEKRNKHTAVWIVAIIFSLIHFQMYGFLPRMVMGALFGYLLIWSGSLWLPIIVHFVNNASIVVITYFGSESRWLDAVENIGKAETYWYGIISALFSGLLIWMIYKSAQHPKCDTQN